MAFTAAHHHFSLPRRRHLPPHSGDSRFGLAAPLALYFDKLAFHVIDSRAAPLYK